MIRGGACAFAVAALTLIAGGRCMAAEAVGHVIVIAMENTNAFPGDGDAYIYGNHSSAKHINSVLLSRAASASNFRDPLPLSVPSEAHYVFMEAGAAAFADFTFTGGPTGDFDPSSSRSTASGDHLVAQIEATGGRVTWSAYQEGISARTGACPVNSDSSTGYAAKHNPFVFFKDVAGSPPSKGNQYCARHMKPFEALAADMKANRLANYVFVTPNLCHDMHDRCGAKDRVSAGDQWLAVHLPPILAYADRHKGVVFLVWDEGKNSRIIPFLALGPSVKRGHVSGVVYDHRSIIKTVERIFRLPQLDAVKASNDLSDLFHAGVLP